MPVADTRRQPAHQAGRTGPAFAQGQPRREDPLEIYSLHGLCLHSELRFPELAAAEGEPQVTLRVSPVGVQRPKGVSGESWFLGTPDDTTIAWRNFGALRVRGGEEIRIDPSPGVDPRWLRSVLLGQAFTLILSQRGLFPLHAGAVVLGDRAVALAGEAGAGKSTLCAALVERGHPFLSDDVTGKNEEPVPLANIAEGSAP